MPVQDIIHVAVKTLDLDASNDFYTKVLGMSIAPRPELGIPGTWLDFNGTQVHIFAGEAAYDADGQFTPGNGAIDHLAVSAQDFDTMKQTVIDYGSDYRENDLPDAKLWQLFVKDPSGILFELNFPTDDEPDGAKGPDGPDSPHRYIPGKF